MTAVDRKSDRFLRIYLRFVLIILSAFLAVEFYLGGQISGVWINADGPMVLVRDGFACRDCVGFWMPTTWPHFVWEVMKYLSLFAVAASFILIKYWHEWEERHDRG